MLAGNDIRQAEATNLFINDAKNAFNINNKSIDIIGLSHSLGSNNNTITQLLNNSFSKVYSVNGAQTNYYQLFYYDRSFRKNVINKFDDGLSTFNIYNISPKELREFAEQYYADKAKNIHQLISLDDPLYAVSGQRGFFTIGEVKYVNTNTDFPGLRELINDIPDDIVREYQDLAIQYTISTEKGGIDQFLFDVSGVKMELIQKFLESEGNWDRVKTYLLNTSEIRNTVRNLSVHIPKLKEKITIITNNAELIFGRLKEAGYINEQQRVTLITEFKNIENELNTIQSIIQTNAALREFVIFPVEAVNDIVDFIKISKILDSIRKSLSIIDKEDFKTILNMIVESHGINEMLNAISEKHVSYIGTNKILTAKQGNQEIRVNLSQALLLYQKGLGKLEEKEMAVHRLSRAVEGELRQAYNEEKRKVLQKINCMETSPNLFLPRLKMHLPFYTIPQKIDSIRVYEEIYPLERADLDDEINYFKQLIQQEKELIEFYRFSIESIFNEDEILSKQFDLIRGV